MRIIGGKYKGRVLCPFDGIGVRPTSDRVRESLFNIIQFEIANACFLDLYAGTGAVGIEALSRGAKSVVLNDNSKDSISLIKKNLLKISNPKEIEVTFFDGLKFLDITEKKFDFVFIDPPYKEGLNEISVKKAQNVLTEKGIVILESEVTAEKSVGDLILYDQRKYGRAYLSFYKRGE